MSSKENDEEDDILEWYMQLRRAKGLETEAEAKARELKEARIASALAATPTAVGTEESSKCSSHGSTTGSVSCGTADFGSDDLSNEAIVTVRIQVVADDSSSPSDTSLQASSHPTPESSDKELGAVVNVSLDVCFSISPAHQANEAESSSSSSSSSTSGMSVSSEGATTSFPPVSSTLSESTEASESKSSSTLGASSAETDGDAENRLLVQGMMAAAEAEASKAEGPRERFEREKRERLKKKQEEEALALARRKAEAQAELASFTASLGKERALQGQAARAHEAASKAARPSGALPEERNMMSTLMGWGDTLKLIPDDVKAKRGPMQLQQHMMLHMALSQDQMSAEPIPVDRLMAPRLPMPHGTASSTSTSTSTSTVSSTTASPPPPPSPTSSSASSAPSSSASPPTTDPFAASSTEPTSPSSPSSSSTSGAG